MDFFQCQTFVYFIFSSFWGEITPRIICPPSHLLAEAVPGNEEDHPCILLRSVIRNQSKGPVCGAGMVEVLFENEPTRSSEICVWWLALSTDLFDFFFNSIYYYVLRDHLALARRILLDVFTDHGNR